jgi:hypothetical protein
MKREATKAKRTQTSVLWLLVFLAVSSAPAMGANVTRLAIIPQEPVLAAAADLLTVTFSTNTQVALVEREQLGRVLREQATISVGGKDFIKLGQLLGADGLLVLQRAARGGKEVLTCRLIAVTAGVALAIEVGPWPLERPVEWCQRVTQRFETLFPKLKVSREDAVPISVVNLRSAMRTRDQEAIEREMTLLLIHRLTKERDVFVLERQHLDEALFEKELRAEESPFWTGRYLLDGVLDKSGFEPERLTINARLMSAQGAATDIELAGPRTNLAAVVDALVVKVLAGLHRNPGVTEWNPGLEAGQFLDEARWAFRWSLWPEAQAASESAWALGLRTPELGALRIRAYGEEVMRVDPSRGNLAVPAVPEAAKLKPAKRAVELFCENASLLPTNDLSADIEWFQLGLHTLLRAASMLDGFYTAAELRAGNEEALAGLRESTRRLIPVLDSKRPAPLGLEKVPQRHVWKAALEKYDEVKWDQGGVWFDRPEDSLPMFRLMLETGSHPKGLPRVVGWTWPDRKRVPAVMPQFVAAIQVSTNPAVRLEGYYLALVREPFDAEGHFHSREAELFAALWDYQEYLWGGPGAASILTRTEAALCDKYRYIYAEQFDREPFTSLVHRLRQEFLLHTTTLEQIQFEQFFPPDMPGPRNYSVGEATELLPLIEQCKNRLDAQPYQVERINALYRKLSVIAGTTNRLASPVVPPRPVEFAQVFPGLAGGPGEVLRVKFIPWRLRNDGRASWSEPKVARLVLREGRLWAMVRYTTEENRFLMNCPTAYVAVDPKTGACDEIPFPQELGFPDTGFEVTKDALFVSMGDHVRQYYFNTKRWEKIVVPIEGGASITAIGGSLFVGGRDGLLELDPKTHALRLLASARRRPPENDLDSVWNPDAQVFGWPDGWIGIQAGREVFSFDPVHRSWISNRPPADPQGRRTVATFSGEGVELLLTTFDRHRLVGFRDHGKEIIPFLLFDKPGSKWLPKTPPESRFGEPRWDWPTPFDLEYSHLLADQDGIWAWQPRKIPHPFGPPLEPFAFGDDRNATLLRFEPGRRQALPVAVRFEKDSQEFDPFDTRHNSHMGWFYSRRAPSPHCLLTPEGAVVSCAWATPGHWLAGKPELSSQLDALRARMAKAAGNGASK